MNYREVFAVDEVNFNQSKTSKKNISPFLLKNFNYYEPKLEKDFYLKYLIKQVLFDIKIKDLNEFLNFQYDNCESPDEFIEILDLEVLPKITDIIENEEFSMNGGEYYNQQILEDGFVETEGVIKSSHYEFGFFSHLIAFNKNKSQVLKRKSILTNFLLEMNIDEEPESTKPLKWIAGPAQLGFIISSLVENGYIEPPLGNSSKKTQINYTKLAKDVLKAFNMDDHDSVDSLRGYLNQSSPKHREIQKHFNQHGFKLPKRNDVE